MSKMASLIEDIEETEHIDRVIGMRETWRKEAEERARRDFVPKSYDAIDLIPEEEVVSYDTLDHGGGSS